MALISIVRFEVMEKRKLIAEDEILDGISLATLLPGPVAMNLVAFVGKAIAGYRGAAIATIAVTLPSFFLVLGFAIAFEHFGEVPSITKLFVGILPAIAAIVIHAAVQMREKALLRPSDWSVAAIAIGILMFIGGQYSIITAIVLAGIFGVIRDYGATQRKPKISRMKTFDKRVARSYLMPVLFLSICLILSLVSPLMFSASPSGQIFAVFSGMSITLFGGGYVFIPIIQETVVGNLGWLDDAAFAAAIAIGQLTPGPILISATFIGYSVAGIAGALTATVAMFLPPAVLMLTLSRILHTLQEIAWIQSAQASIRAAVIGLIASSGLLILMGLDWTNGLVVVATFCASYLALAYLKLSVLWILPIAGLSGILLA